MGKAENPLAIRVAGPRALWYTPVYMDTQLLTISQVAAVLAVHPVTVRRMIKDGRLPVVYLTPTLPRIPKSAVDELSR